MYLLYNILIFIAGGLLKLVALFNPKIKLFVEGRKQVFDNISTKIKPADSVIWFHCASLGEFEQGLPLIEALKADYPTHKIVVSFFSPSGYEVKKNSKVADVITYLPLDSEKNAKRFLNVVHPDLAVFVKYEFWPNMLKELKKRSIKTISISTIFRKNQAFFKWYGSWMRKSLDTFNHFFVQNDLSKQLLTSIGYDNSTINGDTRFDRVAKILEQDNTLDFVESFKNDLPCIVAGSTWPEDETLLVNYINGIGGEGLKFIIAPHTMKPKNINQLKKSITKKVGLYSEKDQLDLKTLDVLIIDTIGLLTKIYSYANIAYVGGGMRTSGLHNTLEPATFGIPIIIGKNYGKFQEVLDLVKLNGITVISDQSSFNNALNTLTIFDEQYQQKSLITKNYVQKNKGAVIQIADYARTLL
ncbi:3-deoxy-D-manno-octulosonic acid transferase [Spongiivirga citrea]|uniref:3-deoxy-D-manno-octulosonic acid transferase n=1 Tax=Spongiivirga citrea TaxID=1481457 RepID=A0A6M0CPK7_9FLAO|nr:glycosyltransferase N-terminal domain-containing protein [Spongiivirga citrea]NER18863.1 3-deoxy-D-manno-octulosonic acid transferase [Spongiivirga citrea]